METTTPQDAARHFDVHLDAIQVLAAQLADDTDLVTEDGDLTPTGMAALARQLGHENADMVGLVANAVSAYQATAQDADDLLQRRDAAIRDAYWHGISRTRLADITGLSRGMIHRITS